MLVYATLVEYQELAPDTALSTPVLEKAERDVRLALRSAVYQADAQGRPVRANELSACQEATLEQVTAVLAAKAETDALVASAAASPMGRPLQSATIGDASYTVAASSAGLVPDEYLIPPHGGLCRSAWSVLLLAGLLQGGVGHVG